MNRPLLEYKSVDLGFDKPLLKNINLEIMPGDFIAMMGKNGCGKTTFIKTLAKELKALSGEIFLNGQNIKEINHAEYAKNISFVYTDRPDTGDLTVKEMLSLARYPYSGFFGQTNEDDEKIIDDALNLFQLNDLSLKKISNLSDGQKQKSFIARAFVQDTPIIILDEPTTYLDIPGKLEVITILKKIAKKRNKAILFTTHDWNLILEMGEDMIVVKDDCSLSQGSPEDFILNGLISKLFSTSDILLSDYSGQWVKKNIESFSLNISSTDKRIGKWTQHALEKIGLEESQLEVSYRDDKWFLQKSSYHSIRELLKACRAKGESVSK